LQSFFVFLFQRHRKLADAAPDFSRICYGKSHERLYIGFSDKLKSFFRVCF
jgi:hypothetical protein